MSLSAPARALAVAAGVSAVLHASLFVGDWARWDALEPLPEAPAYEATIASAPAPAAPEQALPQRSASSVAFLPRIPEAPAMPDLAEAPELATLAPEAAPARPEPPPVVALAAPTVGKPPLVMPPFPEDALPGDVTIRYALSSALAEGEAQYRWRRDGDRYEITGSARAVGFFAIFLEGSMDQRATGRVTVDGLRPEQFTERRAGAADEGIRFNWEAGTVTQWRGANERVSPLEGNTVDWLSMVFQLAHQPPGDDNADLRVYTQRNLYRYRLDVVGMEEIELPIGRVQALHLRHGTPDQPDAVDVWLGVEQHFLPVKLRYPVARNRLVIEQTVRSIVTR